MTHDPTQPLLSVTVLNYNYGHYLPQCLDSILNQTFRDFEVLLINDCSTDNSRDVIAPYLSDPRVRLIDHKTNQGYVASLIEGSTLSRGKYITVISADDYTLTPNAFERSIEVMASDDAISLCYSAWEEKDDLGNVRHTRRAADHDYVLDGPAELRRLLEASPILHSGAMIRRTAYEEVGGYDASCGYSVDTNMWLALCSAGKVAYLNEPLYAYRAHTSNMSQTSGSLWKATAEMLVGIEKALARFSEEQLPDKEMLRRTAQKCALMAVPTLDIFAGRLGRGWHGYWLALRHYPMLTLAQARTPALLLRTVLGDRPYHFVTHLPCQVKQYTKTRKGNRLTAERYA